jgi:fructokinase
VSPALVTVIGEALIDLVPSRSPGEYRAHAGGSPFNVAVALARLGNRTALMARLADHGFGRVLREAAAAEGIDVGPSAHAAELTTLAVVSVERPGHATYDFYLEGTADWQWTAAELGRRPTQTEILHFGSMASWTPPGSEPIDRLVGEARARHGILVSYDPNVRPAVLGAPAHGRQVVERSVCHSHVVKASREDLEWLYPSRSIEEVVARWHDLGAKLIVITVGGDGAIAYRDGARPLRRSGRAAEVVDTIGAGDAFTAAMLSGLVSRDRHGPDQVATISERDLIEVLDEAVLVSSLTCERAGADPPRLKRDPRPRRLTVDDFAAGDAGQRAGPMTESSQRTP